MSCYNIKIITLLCIKFYLYVLVCQGCRGIPYDLSKLFPMFNNENDQPMMDDDDDVMVDNPEGSQEGDSSNTMPTIIEKDMDDERLQSYYNEYILLLKDKQQKENGLHTKEHLYETMTELFNFLEYKYDQSNGKNRKAKKISLV